ncbi:hypothetical protein AB0J35_00990 [Nonomuraea angiospora]|uniref:hypothetical protein n=1 Tax=Nonomuraea angiospora TaxID=46172 RepID=UPI00343F1AC9
MFLLPLYYQRPDTGTLLLSVALLLRGAGFGVAGLPVSVAVYRTLRPAACVRVRHPRVQPLDFRRVLKNAIDFLYAEWNNKAAAFVGHGGESSADESGCGGIGEPGEVPAWTVPPSRRNGRGQEETGHPTDNRLHGTGWRCSAP